MGSTKLSVRSDELKENFAPPKTWRNGGNICLFVSRCWLILDACLINFHPLLLTSSTYILITDHSMLIISRPKSRRPTS